MTQTLKTSAETVTCVVTEVIMTEGKRIGYMYRADPAKPGDSGWRFLTGKESERYMDQPKHYITCELDQIARDHPEVVAFLASPIGASFERDADDEPFVAVDLD